MGVFDTLIVKCPACEEEIHEQFKPGDMECFYWDKLEGADAMRFDGTRLECYNCGKTFELEIKYQITHKGIKELPPQHDEWDDGWEPKEDDE